MGGRGGWGHWEALGAHLRLVADVWSSGKSLSHLAVGRRADMGDVGLCCGGSVVQVVAR